MSNDIVQRQLARLWNCSAPKMGLPAFIEHELIAAAKTIEALQAEVERLKVIVGCECKIEMSTLRVVGDLCPHCGLEIKTAGAL